MAGGAGAPVVPGAAGRTLLPTLTLLGAKNQSGIVFPVGCAMTILLFSAFTAIRFREKPDRARIAGYAAVVAGIFLVKR